MGELIGSFYNINFKIFGFDIYLGNIGRTFNIITGENMTSVLQTYLQGFEDAFVSIALSILVLMVMLDFIKKSLKFDKNLSWEIILMSMVKFCVFMALINNCQYFFKQCLQIPLEFLTQNSINSNARLDVSQKIATAINESKVLDFEILSINVGEMLSPIVMGIVFGVIAIPIIGTQMGIISALFMKVIKFIVICCVSPIPVALSYTSEGPGVRGFIMHAIAICLDLFLSYLLVVLYNRGFVKLLDFISTESAISGALAILFFNGLFQALLSNSERVADELLRG